MFSDRTRAGGTCRHPTLLRSGTYHSSSLTRYCRSDEATSNSESPLCLPNVKIAWPFTHTKHCRSCVCGVGRCPTYCWDWADITTTPWRWRAPHPQRQARLLRRYIGMLRSGLLGPPYAWNKHRTDQHLGLIAETVQRWHGIWQCWEVVQLAQEDLQVSKDCEVQLLCDAFEC
jgi:hypothetical protein